MKTKIKSKEFLYLGLPAILIALIIQIFIGFSSPEIFIIFIQIPLWYLVVFAFWYPYYRSKILPRR